MKRKISITQLLNLFLLLIISGVTYAQTASITITVNELRNLNGVVQFSLYNKEGTVPDEHFTQYLAQQVESIKDNSSTTTFKNLPLGSYAINILHDENEDGKIDKGFMLPTEGVGFSNYSTINLFNQPNFDDASIQLKTDTNITIKVIYF